MNIIKIICLIVLLFFSQVQADIQKYPIEVRIYGFSDAFSSKKIMDYFNNKSDKVIFYDLHDSVALERFYDILYILGTQGVAITSVCSFCGYNMSWREIWEAYAQPLVGFFQGEKLIAITVGVTEHKILDNAFTPNSDCVKIFTYQGEYFLTNGDVRNRLEWLFGKEKENISVGSLDLVLPIMLLALADSVNPCTFVVFTAILLMALHSFGRKKTIVTGLSFILAVLMGYYCLGVGLLQVLVRIPFINEVVAIIGLVIGVFNILHGLKPRFKSPVPKTLRRFVEVWITKSYANIVMSLGAGFLTTFTLLPCTGGPYIVGLGLLSILSDYIQVHLLLILYCAIFVSPLIIILVTLLAFNKLSRKIKAFRTSQLGSMELVGGALIVSVCLYILLSL